MLELRTTRKTDYCHSLLTLCMKVYAANRPLNLVEADVVEPLKTGSSDRSHSVVWDQEMFLPPHEDVLPLRHSRYVKVALPCLLLKRPESGELCPVL